MYISAQPAGAKGAMDKFKSMEPAGAGGAKPKYVFTICNRYINLILNYAVYIQVKKQTFTKMPKFSKNIYQY